MLASLAHGTRLDVFLLLIEAGDEGITAGGIAERLNVVPSSLTHHLNELKATGMVDCVRNHRQMIYTARIPAMKDLISFLTRNCCGGRPELCSPQWSGDERIEALSGVMGDRVFNVLFLCTGNSARSIVAECILNRLAPEKFRAYSAGSQPSGRVHPCTLDLLSNLSFETSDLRSKSWDEFAAECAPKMDFVFTVCDNAANEMRPVWSGQPMSAHWGVPDPAQSTGNDAEIAAVFNETYRMLDQRISIYANLPIASLDKMSLQQRLDEIGKDS